MKRSILNAIVVSSISISTGTMCWGQDSLPKTPPRSTGAAQAAPESAERDEDAALLQKLETDTKQNWAEPKRKGGAGGGIAPMPAAVPFHTQNLIARQGSASRALIIKTTDSDPKTQSALEEDLTVMSHLLVKSLEDLPGGARPGNKVMGIDVFFTPGAAPLRSLYIDNYGAVFFLNVNFPLLAPAEKHVEEKPTGDTAWEEARQEIYGERGAGGEAIEGFSQEKVDRLKETLFESLKNATNIRGLKSDDFVTIWVSGGSSRGGGKVRTVKTSPQGGLGGNVIVADQVVGLSAKRTILTIRVRKSDIDEYAKGKLNAEQFQKRAQLSAYSGDAAAGDNLLFGDYNGRARF